MHGDFFKFERNSGLQYLEIVGTKQGGLLGTENGLIFFAHDLLAGHVEHSFKLAIDMEIAALDILHKYHPRAVIENGLKSRFACVESLLRPLTLGDIAQNDSQEFLAPTWT